MPEYKNLLESAYHWERTAADQVFVTQPMGGGDANIRDWTWRQFMDETRRMATYLKSLDLPEKSHIAICSKNCVYWLMADLAIWMAGHVSIPIFPTLTPETVAYIMEHSESKLLFVGKLDPVWDEMKKGVPEGLARVAFPVAPPNDHEQWDAIMEKHEPLEEPVARAPDEMATIIYTSGSTGRPKGVMHNFGTMLTCTIGICKVVNATSSDRYLSYLPLAHAMERWVGECLSIYTGEHLFFAESLDTFVQDLRRARPTLFLSVPRLWLKFQLGVYQKLPPKKLERLFKIPILNRIVKKKILKQLGLDQVRFAGSGSAPIPKEVMEWYHDLGLELLEGYGLSENFNYSHLTMPGDSRPGYVGTTYPEVECRIGEAGEIQVKGPGSMIGYFKMPEETEETITKDGFLKTGDCGEIDEKGRLMITGRIKEIFKTSKGKYIAPAPIENKVVNHPCIELCCVTGSGFPQPHAVVQLSEDAQEAACKGERESIIRDLEEHLRKVNETLATYERLEFLTIVDDAWLPENGFLTPTMKIKRAKIEEAYQPLNSKWYEEKKPVVWKS
ncbi:MAG: AMP-binding protein [Gemmatimonadales bacterium]|nr:AMP-binding protein [Gemmatimonadales bacterium]NIQ99430.1 AMP-binding protein [Gemmatimonadales bacterium]NIS64098.1 AMP-binding protein [Gemmatimonadales bacterium]